MMNSRPAPPGNGEPGESPRPLAHTISGRGKKDFSHFLPIRQAGFGVAVSAIYLWTESLEKSLDIFIIVASRDFPAL
jgi:hypothetical protein